MSTEGQNFCAEAIEVEFWKLVTKLNERLNLVGGSLPSGEAALKAQTFNDNSFASRRIHCSIL